jgi:hypothetical protein
MTKDQFKKRWESNDDGEGITFNDIAECAKDWGMFAHPRVHQLDEVRYQVLKAARCSGAEDYKPNTSPEPSSTEHVYCEDRPVEPSHSDEAPEAWAEIAEWERVRAERAESEAKALREMLEIVFAATSEWVEMPNAKLHDYVKAALAASPKPKEESK